MSGQKVSTQPKRDTSWRKDGRAKGVYWRPRRDGSKAWGYYSRLQGRIVAGHNSRQEALDAKARDDLRRSAGAPAPESKSR